MTDHKDETHIETDDARAGETTGTMRYVLGISLALAIIAMSVLWIVPALMGVD
ncbi:MAG: hypothetical protein ACXIT4_05705 [Erythrobacter sp.]